MRDMLDIEKADHEADFGELYCRGLREIPKALKPAMRLYRAEHFTTTVRSKLPRILLGPIVRVTCNSSVRIYSA